MARRREIRPAEVLEDLRRTSGWYLAAWRDYRNLTLDDLAAETGIKKSQLSELENGSIRRDGRKPRLNGDHIPILAQALRISDGMLFDVNPYTAEASWMASFDAALEASGNKPDTARRAADGVRLRRIT